MKNETTTARIATREDLVELSQDPREGMSRKQRRKAFRGEVYDGHPQSRGTSFVGFVYFIDGKVFVCAEDRDGRLMGIPGNPDPAASFKRVATIQGSRCYTLELAQ